MVVLLGLQSCRQPYTIILVKRSDAWAAEAGGVAVAAADAKGGRDALEGFEALSDGRSVLKARVRAAPEDGRANAALVELVAKTLGTPKSAVSIAAGHAAASRSFSSRAIRPVSRRPGRQAGAKEQLDEQWRVS